MAMQPNPRMGSNIVQNPFSNARNDGAQFNDPGKRSPTGGQQSQNTGEGGNGGDGSITNLAGNEGFIAPGGKKEGTKSGAGDDPMMDFGSLWEDPVIDPKAPAVKEFKGYVPDIDPKTFEEKLGQLDFSSSIPPEVMADILAGGDKAAAAYPTLINHLGRQAFKMSFNASSNMTKHALGNVEKRFMEDLIPNSIQSRIVDDTLVNDNELAANPKYAPMFENVKGQYTKKFPKATPQQISKATKAYIDDFVATAGKKPVIEDTNAQLLKKGSGEADWDDWINPQNT